GEGGAELVGHRAGDDRGVPQYLQSARSGWHAHVLSLPGRTGRHSQAAERHAAVDDEHPEPREDAHAQDRAAAEGHRCAAQGGRGATAGGSIPSGLGTVAARATTAARFPAATAALDPLTLNAGV